MSLSKKKTFPNIRVTFVILSCSPFMFIVNSKGIGVALMSLPDEYLCLNTHSNLLRELHQKDVYQNDVKRFLFPIFYHIKTQLQLPNTYSNPCQTPKMKLKAVLFTKRSILDAGQGSEYASKDES